MSNELVTSTKRSAPTFWSTLASGRQRARTRKPRRVAPSEHRTRDRDRDWAYQRHRVAYQVAAADRPLFSATSSRLDPRGDRPPPSTSGSSRVGITAVGLARSYKPPANGRVNSVQLLLSEHARCGAGGSRHFRGSKRMHFLSFVGLYR